MERVFGTLQKRLPQELRVAGIETVAAANRYLRERFVSDYNARFALLPRHAIVGADRAIFLDTEHVFERPADIGQHTKRADKI
jgi:hypothetical protein